MFTDHDGFPEATSARSPAASTREARVSAVFPTAQGSGEADVERRQLERLSQVGRACAMVAHEIANPLAAIKATLQSIERDAAAAGLGETMAPVFREID